MGGVVVTSKGPSSSGSSRHLPGCRRGCKETRARKQERERSPRPSLGLRERQEGKERADGSGRGENPRDRVVVVWSKASLGPSQHSCPLLQRWLPRNIACRSPSRNARRGGPIPCNCAARTPVNACATRHQPHPGCSPRLQKIRGLTLRARQLFRIIITNHRPSSSRRYINTSQWTPRASSRLLCSRSRTRPTWPMPVSSSR